MTGEKEILDISKPNCNIDLIQGRKYYFRSACGNLKGYGPYLSSTPAFVVPSTWREVDSKEARYQFTFNLLNKQPLIRYFPLHQFIITKNPKN